MCWGETGQPCRATNQVAAGSFANFHPMPIFISTGSNQNHEGMLHRQGLATVSVRFTGKPGEQPIRDSVCLGASFSLGGTPHIHRCVTRALDAALVSWFTLSSLVGLSATSRYVPLRYGHEYLSWPFRSSLQSPPETFF